MTKEIAQSMGYDFHRRRIEAHPCPIQDKGVTVMVNLIRSKATFEKGRVAGAIMQATSESVR